MPDKPDVLIGLPTFDGSYYFKMWGCYEQLVTHSQEQGLKIMRSKNRGSLVANARCILAERAVELDAKHLLFIDADMVFPPDGLCRLLKHDVDIVSGMYFKKSYPFNPVAGMRDENGKMLTISEWGEGLVDNIEGTGAGFLLIKTDVFRALEKPWFWHPVDPLNQQQQHGEDYGFCQKALEAGHKIHLDTSLQLLHTGHYDYGLRNYQAAMRNEAQKSQDSAEVEEVQKILEA